MRELLLLAAVGLLPCAVGYTYDVVLPGHTPWSCFSERCASWADANATVRSYWGSERALASAGRACAMPAKAVQGPLSEACSGEGKKGYALDGWCLCDATDATPAWARGSWSWCRPPADAPTQVGTRRHTSHTCFPLRLLSTCGDVR